MNAKKNIARYTVVFEPIFNQDKEPPKVGRIELEVLACSVYDAMELAKGVLVVSAGDHEVYEVTNVNRMNGIYASYNNAAC